MQPGRLLGGLTLATVLAVSLTGCATGKLKLDMAKSCQAHGGTWSQAQETCSMSGSGGSASTKNAKDICAYQGGTYLPGGSCILDGT
jgi:hypothetical protein